MDVDDTISYHDFVSEEKATLQKGMNFGVGKKYSVFLMSVREGAPYADAIKEVSGMLEYEGHDEPQRRGGVAEAAAKVCLLSHFNLQSFTESHSPSCALDMSWLLLLGNLILCIRRFR